MKETLFSGQVFKVVEDGDCFFLQSKHHVAKISQEGNSYAIVCSSGEASSYFQNYFCLDFDYSKVKAGVSHPFAVEAINSATMLKILRQDKFETIIDFIVSANNNISRIRKNLFSISEAFGDKIEFMGKTFYSFPTSTQLASATEEQLKALGLGYRAGYIAKTARMIAGGFEIENLPEDTTKANKHLCSLCGIGEKVADCILLFSYQKYDAFPVDTWIEKLYFDDFCQIPRTKKQIRTYFLDLFGEHAGIVQQYLFFYKRLQSINKDTK